MKRKATLKSFQYNENFKKWFWFVNETLVGAFVGALIAFIFGSHYWAALTAFGILILFLIILSIFFIFLENKVSVLSIMNQGLKDGKYEDVIKFGSAMRTTLFTSNKNEDIVTLGYKIRDAAIKIESAHYNKSKGNYLVTIDGNRKSITQIKIGLQIDDLGWSMHLCNKNDIAVSNIIDGIKKARNEALRLSNINEDPKVITPYIKLILRGYRHLSGIYYEDVKQHWRAEFYENVTRLIMSNYKILSVGGICEGRISTNPEITCGLFCKMPYNEKVSCTIQSIKHVYYDNNNVFSDKDSIEVSEKINMVILSDVSLLSESEIRDDIKLFNELPEEIRNSMIKEQCYAWSRNMVKKIQNGLYKQGEYAFISDSELSCKIAEARAFSQIYYNGSNSISTINDFDMIINKDNLGKSELRYLSLMNEIELVNLYQPNSNSIQNSNSHSSSGRNIKIEKLIDRLESTREILRDKRADLYVRTSIHLLTALHLEYNLNHRYLNNELLDVTISSRKNKLKDHKRKIIKLYKDTKNYEHKINDDLDSKYRVIIKDLKIAKKQLRNKRKININDVNDPIIEHFNKHEFNNYSNNKTFENLSQRLYKFSDNEISGLKTKWEA
ncbi:MAG: hypothetical protein N4A71_03235 [Carboxylicivirga sp.]|jgi:hypothetical protein|nr:hypothetical protein [Carboxylicivirga sp.]